MVVRNGLVTNVLVIGLQMMVQLHRVSEQVEGLSQEKKLAQMVWIETIMSGALSDMSKSDYARVWTQYGESVVAKIVNWISTGRELTKFSW